MKPPIVQYAKSGNVHIAYQTLGSGPIDLVMGLPCVTHLAVSWEDAPTAQLFHGLASFARLIIFDKRGVGLSDRDVRGACALRDETIAMGLKIRTGLHSGECIMDEKDVQGIAVHIASRVCQLGTGGQVLVSGTVGDLSVGSGISFKDMGLRTLKGIGGDWRIYSVG